MPVEGEVMIANRDKGLRHMWKAAVTAHEITAIDFVNPEAALSLYETTPRNYRLFLTGDSFKSLRGLELVKRVRSIATESEAPTRIIVMTNRDLVLTNGAKAQMDRFADVVYNGWQSVEVITAELSFMKGEIDLEGLAQRHQEINRRLRG